MDSPLHTMTSEPPGLAESYSYALMYLADEASAGQSTAAYVPGAVSRPTSSLLRLPPEIIYGITNFLSPHELAGILTLSRCLKPIVERVLYRELEPTKARVIPCLKTIVAYPSLASITRRLTICDLSRSYDILSDYLSLLSRALHCMPALTDLTLLLAGPHAKYFLGCPFKLRSLSTTLTWDDVFIRWMEEQSELSNVMFGGAFVNNTVLPPSALPKISQISATPLILSSVVPGRPVKGVEICLLQPEFMKDDIMWIITRILSFSTVPISSIRIIARVESMTETLRALNTIPENVPKLDSFALHAGHDPFTHVCNSPNFSFSTQFIRVRNSCKTWMPLCPASSICAPLRSCLEVSKGHSQIMSHWVNWQRNGTNHAPRWSAFPSPAYPWCGVCATVG